QFQETTLATAAARANRHDGRKDFLSGRAARKLSEGRWTGSRRSSNRSSGSKSNGSSSHPSSKSSSKRPMRLSPREYGNSFHLSLQLAMRPPPHKLETF